MSDSESEWFKQNVAQKSTWKSQKSQKSQKSPKTVLSKGMMKWLYDALVQANDDKDRAAILRRMIDSPPEYETVHVNLITHAFKKFKKDECPPANYKTECYKEFTRVVNQFQDLFTDSGKPLRFTLKRRSSPRATASAAAAAASAATAVKIVSPQRHSPVPLHSSHSNDILQMPENGVLNYQGCKGEPLFGTIQLLYNISVSEDASNVLISQWKAHSKRAPSGGRKTTTNEKAHEAQILNDGLYYIIDMCL